LRRLGIPADALTVFGLLASVVTAFLIGSGHLGWAVLGVIVAGVSDLLDGAIARGSGQASPRGAFFDSVSDRVSDALLLGGTAWYLLGQGSPYLSMLAFAVGACSMLISYERARAESLGLDARGGLMERAERFVFLSVALRSTSWCRSSGSCSCSPPRTVRFVRVYRRAAHPPRVHRRGPALPRDGRARRAASAAPLRTWWTARRLDGTGAPEPPVGAAQLASPEPCPARRGLTMVAYRAGSAVAQALRRGRHAGRPRRRRRRPG
jgi:CDP-diacylglycerol--glycerol-3-phosphate 3-phosphatidyltransferase